ncbi:MAG: 3-deoxy-D-manno-octulosonic acid transferase [Caldimonas sp.]
MKAWHRRLARAAYSALLRAVVPLYLLRVAWRGRAEPLYRSAPGQRLGLYRGAAVPGAVWIHAVSLGETLAAEPLVRALRQARSDVRLVLSHGTATGRAAGQALLRAGDAQAWLPFDTPGGGRRFLDHFAPSVGVLMETEIWPNVLAEAQARGIPVVLANARMSERSRRRGGRVDALLRPAFETLAAVFAQGPDDAERLRAAGAREVDVLGNLKYDIAPDQALQARGRFWRASVGRPVVLAAITREGEEALLFDAWCRLPAGRPLLVVVPRHPQRFDAVAGLIRDAGLSLARRSAWNDGPPHDAWTVDAWLGDSMLEMPLYYGLADVALLGGSFAPLGGQNLIEAAACGCPLVMGPHTFNFSDAAAQAVAAGAAIRVADMAAGIAAALDLAAPEAAGRRAERSSRALAFAGAHRGAAARTAARIVALLDGPAATRAARGPKPS